jgi:hypothetical protein
MIVGVSAWLWLIVLYWKFRALIATGHWFTNEELSNEKG